MGLPSSDDRSLRTAVRSFRSSSGRSLSSQYLKTSARMLVWVSLRSSTLPSSSGPNECTVARTCEPSLPESETNSTGWPAAWPGQPGQVALDVGDEDRDARLRGLAREKLQGLRLAGAGGPGDQPVTVEHRQGDLDPRVVEELAVEHRAADDQARFGEGVAARHRVAERLVHLALQQRADGVSGRAQGYHRTTAGTGAPPHGDRRHCPSSRGSCSRPTHWPWRSASSSPWRSAPS